MAQPTGTFTAEVPGTDPALVAPKSYAPDGAELLREVVRLIEHLPAPHAVSITGGVISLDFDSSKAIDLWSAYLPDEPPGADEFAMYSRVTDTHWSYWSIGEWLGCVVSLNCSHWIPTASEIAEFTESALRRRHLASQPAVQS